MLHDGVRHIQALPPRPARAQAQIGVFAIQEEVVVEAADLIQHRPAIQRGRAAGHKNFFEHREILRRAPVPALLAAAVERHQHARRIEPVLAEKPDLRSAHSDVGARFDRRHQILDPVGDARRRRR